MLSPQLCRWDTIQSIMWWLKILLQLETMAHALKTVFTYSIYQYLQYLHTVFTVFTLFLHTEISQINLGRSKIHKVLFWGQLFVIPITFGNKRSQSHITWLLWPKNNLYSTALKIHLDSWQLPRVLPRQTVFL